MKLGLILILIIVPAISWAMVSVESVNTALLMVESHVNTVFMKNGIFESSNINASVTSETITNDSINFQSDFSIDAGGETYTGTIDWEASETMQDGELLPTIDFSVNLTNGVKDLTISYLSTGSFYEGTQTETISYYLGSWSFDASKALSISETPTGKTTDIEIITNINGSEYHTTALIIENMVSELDCNVTSVIEEAGQGPDGVTLRVETEYTKHYSPLDKAELSFSKVDIFKDGTLVYQMGQEPISQNIVFHESNGILQQSSEVSLISLIAGQPDLSMKLDSEFRMTLIEEPAGGNFLSVAEENYSQTESIQMQFQQASENETEPATDGTNDNTPSENTSSDALTKGEAAFVGAFAGYVTADLLVSRFAWPLGPTGVLGTAIAVAVAEAYCEWKKAGYPTDRFRFEFKNNVIKTKTRCYEWPGKGPTFSQWKRIIFVLIIVALGCNFIAGREFGIPESERILVSFPGILRQVMSYCYGVLGLGLLAGRIIGQHIGSLDFTGLVIATGLISYIIHLLLSQYFQFRLENKRA